MGDIQATKQHSAAMKEMWMRPQFLLQTKVGLLELCILIVRMTKKEMRRTNNLVRMCHML
jgi:hypothetical protein